MNLSTHSVLCLVIAGIELVLAVIFGYFVFSGNVTNFKVVSIALVFILGISGFAKIVIKAIPSKQK